MGPGRDARGPRRAPGRASGLERLASAARGHVGPVLVEDLPCRIAMSDSNVSGSSGPNENRNQLS